MTKTRCVGRRHCSSLNSKSEYEKNPKTQKVGKIIKGTGRICGRNKPQNFTK